MNKIYLIALMGLILITGCKQEHKTEAVDLDAVKDAVTQAMDKYLDAWNSKDKETLNELIADEGQFYGSDPDEIMDRSELFNMYTEFFSDTTAEYSYDIDRRDIKIAEDGKSAIVVEYMTFDDWSPLIPLRQTSHIVKTNDSWQIDLICWGLIVKNEDVARLNEVLEMTE